MKQTRKTRAALAAYRAEECTNCPNCGEDMGGSLALCTVCTEEVHDDYAWGGDGEPKGHRERVQPAIDAELERRRSHGH